MSREPDEGRAAAAASWRSNLALLDIGILSVIGDGDQESDEDAVTQILADALHNSLWERQVSRLRDQSAAAAIRGLLYSRTRHLWRNFTPTQRRGWFLAGLGADAGSELSQVSGRIVALARQTEDAIFDADHETAADRIIAIADTVFTIEAFTPETDLDNWHDVMRQWVRGLALGSLPGVNIQSDCRVWSWAA